MEGDLDSFAAYGGEEAFIAMLAESMGIDPRYFTINSVTLGSVIISFDIQIPEGSNLTVSDLLEK